jgi:glucose-1-phosphate cytidylyltransferase
MTMVGRKRTGQGGITGKLKAVRGEPALADLDVIILCGGQGTRLREETEFKPKPMIEIGGRPILWHIMKIYAGFGVRSFILCLGYRGEVIRDYFLNYRYSGADLIIDLGSSSVEVVGNSLKEDWRVVLAETGAVAQTGARMRIATKYLRNSRFLATYGDGVANINLRELLDNHIASGRSATVTAVHPIARFGEIAVRAGQVTVFTEKPQITSGWVNGGFFVFERTVFDRADTSNELSLEGHILPDLARRNQLGAYHHKGFWQCMDTYRDMLALNELHRSGKAPWTTGEQR